MKIKKADTNELRGLIPVLKEFFPVHVIFTKSEAEIFNYLETFEGDVLVAIEEDEVVGGLAISRKQYGHIVAGFKHIVAKGEDKEVIKALVKEAEKEANAGKIELRIADGEKIPYTFFEELGYEVEGKLKSHYRPDETCYVLGKVVR